MERLKSLLATSGLSSVVIFLINNKQYSCEVWHVIDGSLQLYLAKIFKIYLEVKSEKTDNSQQQRL
jgi:hypothetical protein